MTHTYTPRVPLRIRPPHGSAIVMCRVSGGVTGTRQAPLKDNGQVRYFETLEVAKAEASRLMALRAKSIHSTCDFHYWAMLL